MEDRCQPLEEIRSLTGVYGRGDGFRLGFTRGNKNITYSNRPDHVAQLAEHCASIPKVAGSISHRGQAYFSSLPGVDIHSD